MYSMIFFSIKTFQIIFQNHCLNDEQLREPTYAQAIEKKFGSLLEKITLKGKTEMRYKGDLEGLFSLFVIRNFTSSHLTLNGESMKIAKEFWTINEYSFTCSDGIVNNNCFEPFSSIPIFFESDDEYLGEVLNEKEFKCRNLDLLGHYTKKETAIEYILPKSRLLLNELSKSNDPFETKKRLAQYIQPIKYNSCIEKFGNDMTMNIRLRSSFDKVFSRVKYVSFFPV
ncbi:MAG TPA: hypothetical protein VFC65_04565 [Prolixibacteraceae bacterium]|nr:hypothetical protein [Prolixibacteraceae bacterium]